MNNSQLKIFAPLLISLAISTAARAADSDVYPNKENRCIDIGTQAGIAYVGKGVGYRKQALLEQAKRRLAVVLKESNSSSSEIDFLMQLTDEVFEAAYGSQFRSEGEAKEKGRELCERKKKTP